MVKPELIITELWEVIFKPFLLKTLRTTVLPLKTQVTSKIPAEIGAPQVAILAVQPPTSGV